MNTIKVFVEIGAKRVFVGSVGWPGWCRSGRDENTALQIPIELSDLMNSSVCVCGSGVNLDVVASNESL
jgi:hypothetical protein